MQWKMQTKKYLILSIRIYRWTKKYQLKRQFRCRASWYFLQSCKNSLNSVHVVGNTDLLKAGITMLVFD